MKILEICLFSAGLDGVFSRVKQESLRFKNLGHEVRIFSSNLIKGAKEKAPLQESIEGIKIQRFSAIKLAGESYMLWLPLGSLRKAILEYHPDVIIAHSYRHSHTLIASRVAKEIGAKSILVTHAPFGNSSRSLLAKLYINLFFDPFLGKVSLKYFDKIFAIAKWEYPYLLNLGVPKEKIVYTPNGISEEFFKQEITKFKAKKIIFLGRISPVKSLETLIKAMVSVTANVSLEIIGQAEEDYLAKLKSLIYSLKLTSKITFHPAIFDLRKKIEKLQEADIFVIPSLRESMPQSLIEAMALGKVCISSDNLGGKEIITSGKNGYLFSLGKENELAEKINFCLSHPQEKIQKNARERASSFRWDKLIKILNKEIQK
jgi:glycosyltransferase involved in cell wall biosynthesis